MIQKRLDALEASLDFVGEIERICEGKKKADKANDRAMQGASNNSKYDARKKPERVMVDDWAMAPQIEQLQSRVQSLDMCFSKLEEGFQRHSHLLAVQATTQPLSPQNFRPRSGTSDNESLRE